MAMATGTTGHNTLTTREARFEERRMILEKRLGEKPVRPDSPVGRTVNHGEWEGRGALCVGRAREAVEGDVVAGGGFSVTAVGAVLELLEVGGGDVPGAESVGLAGGGGGDMVEVSESCGSRGESGF
jgi:hypothetical protein